jgi:hypothetical protein
VRDPRHLSPLDGAVIGVVVAALVLLAILSIRDSASDGNPGTAISSTTSTSATAIEPTSTSAPARTATTAPNTETIPGLGVLQINDAPESTARYSRELFPTWLDFDKDGCDTRQEVLAEEAQGPVQYGSFDGRCAAVVTGRWTSVYDGIQVTDPGDLDVDHLVPLAEAWRSGAHAWDPERRARFANHLDEPDHLIAVTASSNRSKGDRPPNEWRPPERASWCRYATAWIRVKITWGLTATTAERDALGQMLERC